MAFAILPFLDSKERFGCKTRTSNPLIFRQGKGLYEQEKGHLL
jgi:hypothetical protein